MYLLFTHTTTQEDIHHTPQPNNILHHTPVLHRADAEGTHPSAFVFLLIVVDFGYALG
jgi:hypothetical protein